MIAILDYGSGNIRSAQRAFEQTGQEVVVTSDFDLASSVAGLVIPGVGAFGACMSGLKSVRGDEIIKNRITAKKKIFGICVGMQVLFSQSAELFDGEVAQGVGIFPNRVERLNAPILPHIGWNSVKVNGQDSVFAGLEQQQFYFVHSYAVTTPVQEANNITCSYGDDFIAAIETDLITATQFHPEKSGSAGLKLIANWSKSL